jgi:hypothetical protein
MKWLYRALMAVAVVGGAAVSGGLLPVALGGVFAAVGTAAGFFHEAPVAGGSK